MVDRRRLPDANRISGHRCGFHPPLPCGVAASVVGHRGAVERVRPKMMTVAAIMAGLLPIMWSHGTGAEVMQRIAVPMIGGMISSTILTLIVIPAAYGLIKGWRLPLQRGSNLEEASKRRREAALNSRDAQPHPACLKIRCDIY
jgi:AcrB/AcrD/AcrF family